MIGDDVGVFVHGRARVVRGGPGEADELRHYWTEVYEGGSPEDWVERPQDARYVEILASSMYSYAFSRERFEAMCDGPHPRRPTSNGHRSRGRDG